MFPDKHKPRILLLTRNLPPLVGGMERLMQNLAHGLSEYSQLTVIGPYGCSQHLPGDIKVYETSAKMIPFLLDSTWLAIKASRNNRFDIIIGGSGLIAPTLRILAVIFRSRTLIFLHGLDLVVDKTIYQILFLPCIRKANKAITNSRNTKHLAVERGVPEDRIMVIHPGTHLPDAPDDEALAIFHDKYSIKFEKIMIFVGRMTKRKGLSRFIQYSLPAILAAEPNAGLLVVGDNPRDSLNKLGEQQEVLAQVAKLKQKSSVVFLGQIDDSDLIACYTAADVQIFPLVDVPGDVEGFGMIAIEAAACGTPTVAFDLGGVGDAISPSNGRLIPAQRYDLFTEAVIETLEAPRACREACLHYAQNFSWPVFDDLVKKTIFDFL